MSASITNNLSDNKEVQFAKINSAFFLVNKQPGKLFIGKDLSITKEVEKQVSIDQALNDVFIFLSQKILCSEQILPTKLLATFKENLSFFVKNDSTPEVQEKMHKIEKFLINIQQPFFTKLNEILKKEVSFLNKKDVAFLHRTLSYLALEKNILQGALNLLAVNVENEKLRVEGLNKGVIFSPFSLEEEILEWNFSISFSQQEKASFKSIIEFFSKLLTCEHLNIYSSDYIDSVKYLVDNKKINLEETSFVDMLLTVLKLREMGLIEKKTSAGFNEKNMVVLGSISKKLIPIYDSSLDELYPHLLQIASLMNTYYFTIAEMTKKILNQMAEDFDPENDEKSHLIYKTIIESENKISCEWFEKIKAVFANYSECFQEKCSIYSDIFNKLSTYRNSFKNKRDYLYLSNYPDFLFEISSEFKLLPNSQIFKTEMVTLPSAFTFTEDRIIEQMQTSTSQTISQVENQTKKSSPAATKKTKKSSSLNLMPKQEDLGKKTSADSDLQPSLEDENSLTTDSQEDPPIQHFDADEISPSTHNQTQKSAILPKSAWSLKRTQEIIESSLKTSIELPQRLAKIPSFSSSNDSFPSSSPPLFQASIDWLEHFQTFIEKSKDLKWVKGVEDHSFGRTLDSPVSHLALFSVKGQELLAGDSTLKKMVGWIVFTQVLFGIEDVTKKEAMIRDLQLGKILSEIAQILNSIPQDLIDESLSQIAFEINQRSTEMVEVMAQYYFLESEMWKTRFAAPEVRSQEMPHDPMLKKILEIILKDGHDKTLVVARDFKNRFIFSRSSRMFNLQPKKIQSWKQTQEKCKAYPRSDSTFSCHFTSEALEKTTVQLLLNVAMCFSQSQLVKERDYQYITDFNFIRGRFITYLSRLNKNNPDLSERMSLFSSLHHLFEGALSQEKWEELFELFRSGDLSQETIKRIVMSEYADYTQALTMTLSQLTCGEVKIVLDYCREAGKLSLEERLKLPSTLNEALHFSAVRPLSNSVTSFSKNDLTKRIQWKDEIDQREVAYLNLCPKCKNLWPVFEIFYRIVVESGLDISSIEALSKLIQNSR
ncbi:MAG: hypothetical protein ACM3JI_05045 [Anaerolineae bacterium]